MSYCRTTISPDNRTRTRLLSNGLTISGSPDEWINGAIYLTGERGGFACNVCPLTSLWCNLWWQDSGDEFGNGKRLHAAWRKFRTEEACAGGYRHDEDAASMIDVECADYPEVIAHLMLHLAHGGLFPADALDTLWLEYLELK